MESIADFQKKVYDYYGEFARVFPWRSEVSDYRVFISEVMLQQTQAGTRTIEKFNTFVNRFPDFESLASASLRDVLEMWKGLGYNRRALWLKQAAEIIVKKHNGILPRTIEALDALPGIGYATACSISAFAFNVPTVFIETNIRTVFLHHFFFGKKDVDDREILPLVEKCLDVQKPRKWYSALMDYGTMLKKSVGNESRRSAHYIRQSTFAGSTRELRGKILGLLTNHRIMDGKKMKEELRDERLDDVLGKLKLDGLVSEKGGSYFLSE